MCQPMCTVAFTFSTLRTVIFMRFTSSAPDFTRSGVRRTGDLTPRVRLWP